MGIYRCDVVSQAFYKPTSSSRPERSPNGGTCFAADLTSAGLLLLARGTPFVGTRLCSSPHNREPPIHLSPRSCTASHWTLSLNFSRGDRSTRGPSGGLAFPSFPSPFA